MPQKAAKVQVTQTLVVTIAPDADARWSQLCDDIGVSEFDFPDDGGKVRLAITSDILIKDQLDSYDGLSFELTDAEPKNLPECPRLLMRALRRPPIYTPRDTRGNVLYYMLRPDHPLYRQHDVRNDDRNNADGTKRESPPLAEWQFLMDSMQFVHDDGLEIWNREQFAMKFGHLAPKDDVVRKIKQGKIPIRKFDKQVYIPKSPAITTYNGRSAYNIWRDSGMTPHEGDHQWFLDHVAYMFPDKVSQDYVLDFMAQLIQFPEVKIHFALLIQSKEGIGKGALATILRRIIGKRNTVEPSNDEVTKAWTGWQESAQLAIINELMAGGSAVVLNRLKAPITEPFLRIEKKFGNAFDIPNHMNIFGMTNFKDALPIRHDDRRWLILYSAVAARPPDYYNDLFENIGDDSKVAAVMHFLTERVITLNPKAPAPMTAAKRDMADLARSDVAIMLRDLFDERRKPFHCDLVRMADVVAKIKEEPGEKNVNKTASAFLEEIGAVKLERDTNVRGAFNLYAVRNAARYQKMGRAKPLQIYKGANPDLDAGD